MCCSQCHHNTQLNKHQHHQDMLYVHAAEWSGVLADPKDVQQQPAFVAGLAVYFL
jgi:hypothetical protein